MNKKNTIKNTAAIFLGLALTLGATGCDFIRTDNAKDMAQTVATVNIAAELEGAQATELSAVIAANGVQTDIPKRDLVAYFLNVGYTYVQQYGYTYKASHSKKRWKPITGRKTNSVKSLGKIIYKEI